MKTFLFLATLIFSIHVMGQKSSFSVDQINGEVLLTVSIHSGNFCNGIDFLRSSDSINYEVVGSIQGYCGNLNETVTYTFTDKDPIINQKSYYKANLVGLESTETISILVLDFGGKKYQLTSNPITDVSTLFFKNAPNKEVTFTMYNLSGQIAYKKTNNSSSFDITSTDHENGVYVFMVMDEDGKELATGKLLISHP